MVGIATTVVGDRVDLLLGGLSTLGCCQPDATFVATVADLRERLVEMAASGAAVGLDGLATGVQPLSE